MPAVVIAGHRFGCYDPAVATVAFDTLKLARRLQSAGFSREQADGTAEALAETLVGEIATKSDLAELRVELRSDIAELKAELKGDIANLRTDMAKWIISAVFVNILSLLGVVAVIWQLAHK